MRSSAAAASQPPTSVRGHTPMHGAVALFTAIWGGKFREVKIARKMSCDTSISGNRHFEDDKAITKISTSVSGQWQSENGHDLILKSVLVHRQEREQCFVPLFNDRLVFHRGPYPDAILCCVSSARKIELGIALLARRTVLSLLRRCATAEKWMVSVQSLKEVAPCFKFCSADEVNWCWGMFSNST